MTAAAGEAPEVGRALAAFARVEFQTPVAGLHELVGLLVEDAAAAGLGEYEDDLGRMRLASERLCELVSALLEGEAAPSHATLRHDLRTPLTAILGYGELIAEEAADRAQAPFLALLSDTLAAARHLLAEIDKLVAFGAEMKEGLTEAAVPDVLRQAVEAIATRPSVARTVTGRILVVDDNASMRDLLSRRLLRNGHDVTVRDGGRAALALADGGGFDLVLLDLMMPDMNGLEVLEQLRARETTRNLPVIVISALDEVETAVRCIEAGADDVLSKPLNDTLLRARITASLERKFLRDRELDALARLQREQTRSEALLRNVLPAGVVERLRRGETVVADQFDDVTVLFCDIVDFTALSSRLTPAETLDLLNAVFSGFDRLAETNGLEKIKTIGDAYMVVGGMSDPASDHALRVVRMARGMAGAAASVGSSPPLTVRVGAHSGPAAAGIIGRRKFFYDVWGDTVNIASRLEALAEPGRVHISQSTRDAIGDAFPCEAREPIDVKGLGPLQTYYVM